MPENLKKIEGILHGRGFKATPARIAILRSFSTVCKPMSAEQVYKKIRNMNIDLVTVYRTLSSFEQGGLLRRVDMKKDSSYFERNDNHHHHIICMGCERVSDFTNADDGKIIVKALKQVKDFKIISEHSLELFGICNACVGTK